MGHYFIRSNGNLFRLTKKAYKAWVLDSTNRMLKSKKPAKLKNYGLDLGQVSGIQSVNDFSLQDFVSLNNLVSGLDIKLEV